MNLLVFRCNEGRVFECVEIRERMHFSVLFPTFGAIFLPKSKC